LSDKKPKCEKCGGTGHGVVFNIFGPYPFGKYCVPCEKKLYQETEEEYQKTLNDFNYVGSKHHY
jgi:hypothetical protein